MKIIEIINKKKNKKELTKEELEFAFNGFLKEEIKDYQMSSLLMAICINDLSFEEIINLTDIFINSGNKLDLSSVEGIKVDKHSTGGVGDKTTLIVSPIVASLGVIVPKMSGRGLGYTGGTIDKLESIPGMRVNLTEKELIKELKEIGMSLSSQTEKLVPMDGVIYSLRDVTGTVESIPLIAVSIMSKKIASSADKIVLDVKYGSGALLENKKKAQELKDIMIRIGEHYNVEVRCLISDMNVPLGQCIGNALEVAEAVELLDCKVKNNLFNLSVDLATNMVSMGKNISMVEARYQVLEAIESRKALEKFKEFVEYQGGNLEAMKISNNILEIKSNKNGIVEHIDALEAAKLSYELGSGRSTKEDSIDHSVGIFLNKLVGDEVKDGDILFTVYYNKTYSGLNFESIYVIK